MGERPPNYNQDDFDRTRPVEDTHFWFVTRNDVLAAALSTLPSTGAAPAARVLEVGCGTGNTLRVLCDHFPNATVVGMDAFHAGLLYARDRTGARLVEARIERMPFRATFAVIGIFDVLEHIEDDVAALTAIRELLAPGGTLMVTVPADPALWSRFDDESGHQRRYTERQLREVLAAARFQVDYITHFMSVTYPVVWMSRRLERLRAAMSADGTPQAPVIERELRVPHAINSAFRQLLRVEAPAIRRRYRLPFGASLLAMARV